MTFRERIWVCTALGSCGGLLAGGFARWSGQAVFPMIALWVACGVLPAQAAVFLTAFGRLVQRATHLKQTRQPASLPYGQAGSPAARWAAALAGEGAAAAGARLARKAALGLLAVIGVALLAQLFGRQVAVMLLIGVGTALLAALALAPEPLVIAVLTATAWGAASVAASAVHIPQLLAGVLAAMLLAVATHPAPNAAWRIIALFCGLALGLLPAIGQQPALASVIWVSALLIPALPPEREPGAMPQIAAGLCALAGALAIGHWG